MAAKDFVQVPQDSTGKKIGNVSVSLGGQTVELQGVFIADTDDDGHALRVPGPGVLQAIPTPGLSSDLVTGDCKIDRLYIVNTSAAAVTVTVQDKTGTPLKLLEVEMAPKSAIGPLDMGRVKMTGGIRWGASGAGVNGYLVAFQ